MFSEYNTQEEKEKRILLIGNIIESPEFKEVIKNAILSGKFIDYGYDGVDEFAFETFDENTASDSVIEILKKQLL